MNGYVKGVSLRSAFLGRFPLSVPFLSQHVSLKERVLLYPRPPARSNLKRYRHPCPLSSPSSFASTHIALLFSRFLSLGSESQCHEPFHAAGCSRFRFPRYPCRMFGDSLVLCVCFYPVSSRLLPVSPPSPMRVVQLRCSAEPLVLKGARERERERRGEGGWHEGQGRRGREAARRLPGCFQMSHYEAPLGVRRSRHKDRGRGCRSYAAHASRPLQLNRLLGYPLQTGEAFQNFRCFEAPL